MTDDTQRLLTFNLKGVRYALDLHDVAEVLDPPVIYPVPWTPGCFKGAMNFHGSLVSVLDLAAFMSIGSVEGRGSILVLDRRIANLALWVDEVVNIVPCDLILEEDVSNDQLVEKLLILADGEIRKLGVQKLLERAEETLIR